MFHIPDPRPLFYLAMIGLAVLVGGAFWLAYHLARAVLLYVGAI